MEKILFLVISAVLTLAVQAQEQVSDYFYPRYSQEYTWLPESDFPQELEITVSYRGWEQVIQEKLRMTDQNGYPMGSIITTYAYDISDNAVISTGQLYSNFLGKSRRNAQESSPTPQFKSINSSVLSFHYGPTLTSIHDYWKNHSFD